MIELWRRLTYSKWEHRMAASDDFSRFANFASGPWTPDMVRRMPWPILMRGPKLGGIDSETRKVIDLEVERRFRSPQPLITNLISIAALVVSILTALKIW